jgi:hypothetical protein
LNVNVITEPIQTVSFETFDQLEAQDILFIDSSHVAKVGSDVTFLLLRLLPRLKPGVIIHFHDIVYPLTYPEVWIREGRAWHESLMLRAFLIGNPYFKIMAFNNYATHSMPEVFQDRLPSFLEGKGCSLWIRKIA